MTTIKTVGCGGRYSYIAFLPCQAALLKPNWNAQLSREGTGQRSMRNIGENDDGH